MTIGNARGNETCVVMDEVSEVAGQFTLQNLHHHHYHLDQPNAKADVETEANRANCKPVMVNEPPSFWSSAFTQFPPPPDPDLFPHSRYASDAIGTDDPHSPDLTESAPSVDMDHGEEVMEELDEESTSPRDRFIEWCKIVGPRRNRAQSSAH
ncbi:hypothetical protein CROQUDRAFT_650539 [Cronartium quercuum f. sp. fusiforme G11]|uniref:Uncharacterized protein n=1 Tax=Cronartium quercuum f. sp. fusiforme G11 TaxID=708437 RepID=A0A9P6NRD3_9BASI|nr:hypothetical protein CROQUDRAFT_650539 [Cronartium quercuum f. sp. fusiforme G11]